jgi:small subunit ribosomal protein S13
MAEKQQKAAKSDVKYIVRIANTDLDGQKGLLYGLQKIKGVGFSFANAICRLAKIETTQKIGLLSEAQVKTINDVISNHEFPEWMFNRRKDYETGNTLHLFSGDLSFTQDNDLKRMKMTKSYRGLRHAWGLTVRGQQTKSNHRRSKAKNAAAAKKQKGKR